MKRTLNLGSLSRIVEGDPNEITDDEILVIKDKIIEGKIIDIQKRVDGKLVSLITEKYTYTINPTPADAIVVINGSTTKSVRAAKGHTVTWSVSKTGFVTQSGSDVISGDVLKNVTLVANPT
jgi:hypothetical protein